MEELTVWVMSRVPFAVWNTVAARRMAAVAISNASATMFGEQKRLGGRREVDVG